MEILQTDVHHHCFIHLLLITGIIYMASCTCTGGFKVCDVMQWVTWSECSTKCGVGTQQRYKPVCCDIGLDFWQCLNHCKIDYNQYQKYGKEKRYCAICFNGTYNSAQNACHCFNGYTGACCNAVLPVTRRPTTSMPITARSVTQKLTNITPKDTTKTKTKLTITSTTKTRASTTNTTPTTITTATTRTTPTKITTATTRTTPTTITTATTTTPTKITTATTRTTPTTITTATTRTTPKTITTATTRTTPTKITTTTTRTALTQTTAPTIPTTPKTKATSTTMTRASSTTTTPTPTIMTTSTTTTTTPTTKTTPTANTRASTTTTRMTKLTTRTQKPIIATTKYTTTKLNVWVTKGASTRTAFSSGIKPTILSLLTHQSSNLQQLQSRKIDRNSTNALYIPSRNEHINMMSVCIDNPCFNGTCIPISNQYLCFCIAGFEGKYCDLDTYDCANDPCMNGQCVDKVNDFVCDCSVFFEGKTCSHMKIWAIAFISIAVLAFMGACCCCAWCIASCHRDNDRKKANKVKPLKCKPKPSPIGKPNAWLK